MKKLLYLAMLHAPILFGAQVYHCLLNITLPHSNIDQGKSELRLKPSRQYFVTCRENLYLKVDGTRITICNTNPCETDDTLVSVDFASGQDQLKSVLKPLSQAWKNRKELWIDFQGVEITETNNEPGIKTNITLKTGGSNLKLNISQTITKYQANSVELMVQTKKPDYLTIGAQSLTHGNGFQLLSQFTGLDSEGYLASCWNWITTKFWNMIAWFRSFF